MTPAFPEPPADARTGRSLEHWLALGLASCALLAFVASGLFLNPDPRGFGTHERLGLPPCWPMEWWNIPCPGCGVTTSVALAAHFEIWPSIRTQPFGFLCALIVPIFFVWAWALHLRGRNVSVELTKMRLGKWGVTLTVVLIGSWIYKLAAVRHWIG